MAQTLKERLSSMTPDQLHQALRRTAEGNSRRWAANLARFDNDRGEGLRILEEDWEALAAASEEVERRHER